MKLHCINSETFSGFATLFIYKTRVQQLVFKWLLIMQSYLWSCLKYSETKNMKSVIKFKISQYAKTINFLDVCITLNQQNLSTTVFSKPTDAHIYLNPKSCHPEHMIRNMPKSQFLRLGKICFDTSDYIKKSNDNLNFFIKQG